MKLLMGRRLLRHGSARNRRLATLGLAAAFAVTLAGCGEVTNTINPKPGTANTVTVELSGAPSAADVGIYAAAALGYFKQTDMNVVLRSPRSGQDPLVLLHQDQTLIAISSEPSVFLYRNENIPVVAVGALIQGPLSQIPITLPVVHPPSGGVGLGPGTATTTTTTTTRRRKTKRAKATATSTVTTATGTGTGTTTTATGTVTTGTTTTTTPTVSEVPTGATWPLKLQQLLAQSSAPTYNALVVVVRKITIVQHAGLIRRFVQAVARGYRAVRADPRAAVTDMIAADPALKSQRRDLLASVRSLLPHYFPSGKVWGWQPERYWNAFGTWLSSKGLLNNQNAISDASTNELLQGQGV